MSSCLYFYARLSERSAFILNALLVQQNACTNTLPRVHLSHSFNRHCINYDSFLKCLSLCGGKDKNCTCDRSLYRLLLSF